MLEEILDEPAVYRRTRRNQRGVKRKMSNFPVRRGYKPMPPINIRDVIEIDK